MTESVVHNLNLWRQMGIVDPDLMQKYTIHLIGAGGIGSPTAMVLAKAGFLNAVLYDDDIIEAHNLPNQMYPMDSINNRKVDELAKVCEMFSGAKFGTKFGKVTPEISKQMKGVVISGVDSMESRGAIWEGIQYNLGIPLYIDARMGAETCIIHTVNPIDGDDVARYEASIDLKKTYHEALCTERAIIYNTFMIAALIASQVKKFIIGQPYEKEIIFDLVTLTLLK